jgi:galactokinase
VDYSGYGVLPMALELAVRMAVAVAEDGNESTGGVIKLANTDARFPTREVSADPQAAVGGASGHDWSGYFQCGYKVGAAESCFSLFTASCALSSSCEHSMILSQ